MLRSILTALFCALMPAIAFPASPPPLDEDFSRQELFSIVVAMRTQADQNALPQHFAFPADARPNSDFGIDVSHYTEDGCHCHLDWASVSRSGVKFVYLKASQGVGKDSTFSSQSAALEQARKAGVPLHFAAYHFLSSTADAALQADFFLDVTAQATGDLSPSLDLEWDPGKDTSVCPQRALIKIKRSDGSVFFECDKWVFVKPAEIVRRVNVWLDAVAAVRKAEPIVYTNRQWWLSQLGDLPASALHTKHLWIADYSRGGLGTEKPSVPSGGTWSLWQFSESAALSQNGHTILVDASIVAPQ